jgi:RNA polymerase sigma factor (TIGR02999 family)
MEDGVGKNPVDVTRLLDDWRRGDETAVDRLLPAVYREMRDLARAQLRRLRPGNTLDTTALVHEAYLKLVDHTRADLHDRNHFFAVASRAMRQILVDYARARAAQKRGGGADALPLEEDGTPVAARAAEIVAVDQALTRLETVDPRLVRLVELRFFAGLSVEETATALSVSDRTVKRDWQKARALLAMELRRAR